MFDRLKGFQRQDEPLIDEHDEPTEPIRKQDVAAFVPTIPNDVLDNEADTDMVPVPRSGTHPFPHRYNEPVPVTPVYPVLPPRPNIAFQSPPGGQPAQIPPGQTTVRRSVVPYVVGMCFVALQVLLLVRFVLRIADVSSNAIWVGVVYGVSNVFILPFRVLFLELSIPQLYAIEFYTLVAIVAYGMISRLLVRTLKVILKTR